MIHQISLEEATKHKTANTSIESYNKIKDELGDRQLSVLKVIKATAGLSNREIALKLNLPINCVCPRVKELRDLNMVYQLSTKHDEATNRNVKVWGAYE